MKNGCVYFHQGWTDIIMCLGLINYYKEHYDILYIIIRSDSKKLLDFYIRNLDKVYSIPINTDNGRYYGEIDTNYEGDVVIYENNIIKIPSNTDVLFHYEHDRYRRDKYKSFFWKSHHLKKTSTSFAEEFYSYYDIDYMNRIKNFKVCRDSDLENETYQDFIKENGSNYILYHDDELNHLHGIHHVSTKIKFDNIIKDYTYVNLNKKSNIFFDYLKIIENAKELHLIDSIWASVIYQMDAKTNFLNNKKVNLYCFRNHQNLFEHPIKLDNWVFKT